MLLVQEILVADPMSFNAVAKRYSTKLACASLGLFALWFGLIAFIPLGSVLQIGADEGFELTKATQIVHGHKLYSEVWNDQPPLHTFVLAGILKNFSNPLLWARLLTVGCATTVLGCLFLLALRSSGPLGAVVSSGLLIVSPAFLELSSSCMLEIPSLAFAVSALTVLALGAKMSWPIKEILAGALFGIAMEVKLISAILLPIATLIIWMRVNEKEAPESRSVFRRTAWSLALMGFSLVVTFVAIDWAIDRGAFLRHFQQSWSSHFAAAKSFEYGTARDHSFDWAAILRNWDTSVLALFGIFSICVRRQLRGEFTFPPPRRETYSPSVDSKARAVRKPLKTGVSAGVTNVNAGDSPQTTLIVVPLIWLLVELLVFSMHRPWWSYYYVHIALPLCWLAGIGVAQFAQGVIPANHRNTKGGRRRSPDAPMLSAGARVFLSVCALCGILWVSARAYLQIIDIRTLPRLSSALVLQDIARFKPVARYMFADEAIYSFHAGIPTPPSLAIIPLKRFWSGDMTNARLAADMYAAKPELMLLKNDSRERPFSDLVSTEYQLIYEDQRHRLFARRDVAKRERLQ